METLVRNDPEKIPFCRCCCCLPRLLLFLYLVVEERREEAEVVCADERFSNFYDDLRVSGRRISLRIFHVAINPILPLYRRPVQLWAFSLSAVFSPFREKKKADAVQIDEGFHWTNERERVESQSYNLLLMGSPLSYAKSVPPVFL